LSHQPDYSILDEPEILQFVFYPRREWTPLPPGARDYLVPVGAGISISCRFYPFRDDAPCILFFHGNGEVACDYDQVAPLYHEQGISLFVADYRGYGLSDGEPTFSSMMSDAEAIFDFFVKSVKTRNRDVPLFLMGRSLGSHSAVALASRYPERVKGLILESGSANVARLLRWLGFPLAQQATDLEEAAMARIHSLTLPVLIIHGECDSLIPPTEATTFFETVGSKDKRLVLIPGGTHNDVMLVGLEQYFSAIKEFVFR